MSAETYCPGIVLHEAGDGVAMRDVVGRVGCHESESVTCIFDLLQGVVGSCEPDCALLVLIERLYCAISMWSFILFCFTAKQCPFDLQ